MFLVLVVASLMTFTSLTTIEIVNGNVGNARDCIEKETVIDYDDFGVDNIGNDNE